MRRVAICTGVLGGGTALVFAAAVGASALFPNGGTIAAANQVMLMKGGMAVPLGGPAVNFGTGGTTTVLNADGSTTTISGGGGIAPDIAPVPVPAPVETPAATTGP